MPRASHRRRRNAEEVRELVAQFRHSGLSTVAFAKQAGVHPNTVSYWIRRAAEDGAARSLVPVRLKIAPSGADGAVEIILRSGVMVRVHPGFNRDLLLEVLSALDPSC